LGWGKKAEARIRCNVQVQIAGCKVEIAGCGFEIPKGDQTMNSPVQSAGLR